MNKFCFKNMCNELDCEKCMFNDGYYNVPKVEINNSNLRVTFGERIISTTFSGYFGEIQDYIQKDCIKSVEIDFRNTEYINLFCISKIILTIMSTKNRIRYSILWPNPEQSKSYKMLRFLYNKGIIDVLFECEDIENIIEGNLINSYKKVYDFSNCIDSAIFPYKIYYVEKHSPKRYSKELIKKSVEEIMVGIEKYFRNTQENNYENIKNRLNLYLYEIIENIYEHAYYQSGVFGVLVTYDYLPKYLWNKDREGKNRYMQREKRMQKENPLSLFGDIEDRYIGGISIWIDDIGKGIAQTVKGGFYQQMYRDTYLNGLNEQFRGNGKTKLNGLKLIGDEIANNGDYLWLHDCWHWVGTHCNELKSTIALIDESRKEGINAYEHSWVKGCTYEIKINLARNSKGKNNSYKQFGVPMTVGFDELRRLCEEALSDSFVMKNTTLIDLFNSENHTKKIEDFFCVKDSCLLYRSRVIRKEQFKNELFSRIFLDRVEKYYFEEFVIYDLSQTALFQVRALIETKLYSQILIKHGIKTVVLVSAEFYVFVLEIEDETFKLRKKYSEQYIRQNKDRLLFYFKCFQKNDNAIINSIIKKNKKHMLISADIQWGSIQIEQYLDFEVMLQERQIFTVLRNMLVRVSGMLSADTRICFIEDFLEERFAEYLNEFSPAKAVKAYVGSLLLTKQTERKRAMKEDGKIYLFKHRESALKADDTYIFLLNFPIVNLKKQKTKYRRIEATHRIERYMDGSDEFKVYFTRKYEHLVQQLDYKLGLHSTGVFNIIKNKKLKESFKIFVAEQLSILIKKYEYIGLEADINLVDFCGERQEYIDEIKELVISKGNRRILEKKFVEGAERRDSRIKVYITYSIELIKLLEIKVDWEGCIVISVFNEIKSPASLDRLINSGYIPFIPIFHKNASIVTEDDLKTFKAFYESLVPTLRKEVDILFEKTQGGYNFDFLVELQRYFNKENSFSILYDAIINYILYSINSSKGEEDKKEEYDLLLTLLLWQEQKIRMDYIRNDRLLESIMSQLECHTDKGASILIYYCMLVLYIFQASLNVKSIETHRENIKRILRTSKNPYIKVIFANILNQWNTFEFRKELNEIFVGNDISLYYQILYQNTYNDFGEDHDSVLYKYCKNKQLTEEETQKLPSLVSECISLLKLTRPYYEEEEQLVVLEEELKKLYQKEDYGFEFREKCEQLREYVKTRFVVIEVSNLRNNLKGFITKRIWEEAQKKSSSVEVPCANDDFIICPEDKPKQMNKLIFPNDYYVVDELVFLFLDAVKYSNGIMITNASNEEKQSIVWVKCYIEDGGIVIKFFNNLSEKFDDVLERIQNKKRVGKTHLEKFNIAVSYEEDPKEVHSLKVGGHTIATTIVIPYFN